MLKTIQLTNFKCFKSKTIEIKPLTILSGLNSMGKSTIIESLLVLRQSYLHESTINNFKLMVNGEYGKLGRGSDILCDNAEEDILGIAIREDEKSFNGRWTIKRDSLSGIFYPESLHESKNFENSILFSSNDHEYIDFAYIAAERLGPRSRFDVPDEDIEVNHNIGTKGEFAAFYFDAMQSKELPIKELAQGEESHIAYQVNKWLKAISPSVSIKTITQKDLDAVQLAYMYPNAASGRRSINVGFGLTYTLPIILALLTVRKGGLLLLENPEAHLHPKAQTMIGNLIAQVVEHGVQVILETHSDHIINGIRVAVKEKKLNADKALIQFFTLPRENNEPELVSIHILENGKLDQWPTDFLSEWEDNLFKLL